jgi:hypothetical protein
MALPLLALLPKSAAIAFPLIKSGVARGMTGRAIERGLKTVGLGIRRENLTRIINALKGVERAGKGLRFLGLSRLPNIAKLPPAITRIRRRFSFIVQVTGRLLDTGEQIIQNITVASNTVFSRRELERMAQDAVTGETERYGLEVVSALLIEGLRAGEAGVL